MQYKTERSKKKFVFRGDEIKMWQRQKQRRMNMTTGTKTDGEPTWRYLYYMKTRVSSPYGTLTQ